MTSASLEVQRMSVGARWGVNVLVYAVFAASAFAVGSTGWPGKWFVFAAEWVSGTSLGAEATDGGSAPGTPAGGLPEATDGGSAPGTPAAGDAGS